MPKPAMTKENNAGSTGIFSRSVMHAPFKVKSEIKKVLVVDDEPDHLRMFSELMRRFNARAIPATDVGEAIERFFEHGGEFLAVVVDLHLPDMSGFELIEWLQMNAPEVPILAVTGKPEVAQAVRGDDVRIVLRTSMFTGIAAMLEAIQGTFSGQSTPEPV